MRRFLVASAVVTLTLVASSCAKSTEFFSSTSPDGRWKLSALSSPNAESKDDRLQIKLTGPQSSTLIYNVDAAFTACFAHAHWTADSQVVAVLVRNCLADKLTSFAYDVRTQRVAGIEALKQPLRSSIVQQYGPLSPPNVDPLEWVRSNDAQDRFGNRR